MDPRLAATHEIRVGEPRVIESRPAEPPYAVVFEDDGDTGYLYALSARRDSADVIVDALHVYNAAAVTDADRSHELRLTWADDQHAVALTINGRPHAMVDFAEPRSMCLSGLPPPGIRSPVDTHAWDGAAFARRFPALASTA